MLKISIVVPIYNAQAYLEECIQSVVQQTCSNWEVILVDDGSTDQSLDICRKYEQNDKERIKVYHKENEGQLATRLYGIQRCTGDYIGFLDADDVLHKEYVSSLIEVIENLNEKIDVICFGFKEETSFERLDKNLSGNGVCEVYKTVGERKKVYIEIIEGKLPGSMCSKLFEAENVKKTVMAIDSVIDKRYGEDAYQAFSIMAKAECIAILDLQLYFYRINQQGASKANATRELDYFNTRYVFELLEDNLAKWGIDSEKCQMILQARNFNETVYHLLKYFRSASGIARKLRIIKYDWTVYLMKSTLDNLQNNKYCRQSYMHVWNTFRDRKYMEIFIRETFKRIIGW